MQRFYIAFANNNKNPDPNTYLVVIAGNKEEAEMLVRKKYPDNKSLNFYVHTQREWEIFAGNEHYKGMLPAEIIYPYELPKNEMYKMSWKTSLEALHEKIEKKAAEGRTNCSIILGDNIEEFHSRIENAFRPLLKDGNRIFPPYETVMQLLQEGYDVIYGNRPDYFGEIVIVSWGEGTSGKVYRQKGTVKRKSSLDKLYKHFGI